MNISGISPWYFYNGQKRENPQKRGNMREAFDRELNAYLERTSKKPFRECDCGCGKNVFDSYYAIKTENGLYFCEDCTTKEEVSEGVCECCGFPLIEYGEARKAGDMYFCPNCEMKVYAVDGAIEPTDYI